MNRIYLAKTTYSIPRFFYRLIVSWMACLTGVTAFGITLWLLSYIFPRITSINLLDLMPKSISLLCMAFGLYTGIGAMLLWVVMWVYWAAVEEKSFSIRASWFLALVFGLYYGALIYAFIVRRKGVITSEAR